MTKMADDIDDLLNEVETKFCASDRKNSAKQNKSSEPKNRASHSSKSKSTTSASGAGKKGDADLNAMIDDIFDDSVPLEAPPTENKSTSSKPSSAPVGKAMGGTAKCFPVYLGGMNSPRGICSAANKRVCDSLRCTDCDFAVEMFDDVCWHPSTDYLFLRNNMPDYHKLKSKLVSRKGWRAYSCQCKSKSVEEVLDVQNTNMKWVCGRH